MKWTHLVCTLLCLTSFAQDGGLGDSFLWFTNIGHVSFTVITVQECKQWVHQKTFIQRLINMGVVSSAGLYERDSRSNIITGAFDNIYLETHMYTFYRISVYSASVNTSKYSLYIFSLPPLVCRVLVVSHSYQHVIFPIITAVASLSVTHVKFCSAFLSDFLSLLFSFLLTLFSIFLFPSMEFS